MGKRLMKWCGTFESHSLWIVFGFLAGVVTLSMFISMPNNWLDILRVAMSAAIAISVVIAAQQFRYNRKQAEISNEWNKKQLAVTQMHASRKIMKEAIRDLHGHFEILEQDEAYLLYQIHDAMGVRLSNRKFVFHGEATEDEIKLIPETQDDQGKFQSVSFHKDIKGREVKDNIVKYLGEFEYICSALNNDIFDDDTVKSLLKKNITRAYIIFEEYIKHLQEIHGDKYTYRELQKVALRYLEDNSPD